ncbi:transcriptional regulator [Comamonas thiooxydans]|uniref:Transcriptional regulator n=2 Tax=Comamonas thiooxydans TaxID=363952 RepID=A0A0E3CGJ7_9BURK|nr:transcriptional regulator [Comamonas thiooxydans]KGH18357.1 transcriptional regulator [Comamonas thiooxydans]
MTKLMSERTYQCTNPECGHTFIALVEIVRTLSPSATPDPSINIPLSSHVRRDVMRTVLDHAEEAAHQPRYTKPITGDLFACESPPG